MSVDGMHRHDEVDTVLRVIDRLRGGAWATEGEGIDDPRSGLPLEDRRRVARLIADGWAVDPGDLPPLERCRSTPSSDFDVERRHLEAAVGERPAAAGMYECPRCDGTGAVHYESREAWLADGKRVASGWAHADDVEEIISRHASEWGLPAEHVHTARAASAMSSRRAGAFFSCSTTPRPASTRRPISS